MARFAGGMRTKRQMLALGLLVAAGAAVINAAAVYACTGVMGPFLLTPTSGPPGTVVSTSASGLKPYPAVYQLFYNGECMTFTGKLLKSITTNSSGGWTNVTVTIPKKTKLGQHSLCGIEEYPVRGQTATTHGSFTVV